MANLHWLIRVTVCIWVVYRSDGTPPFNVGLALPSILAGSVHVTSVQSFPFLWDRETIVLLYTKFTLVESIAVLTSVCVLQSFQELITCL